MAKLTLDDISAGYSSTTTINDNNLLVETAVENTLSRDGTSPNQMGANLDLNSYRATNLADATNNQDAVTLSQLNAASVVASTIAASAVTVADAGASYAATTAEAAFAELASVANGEGASIIGVEDSAGNLTATDVEAALAEIFASLLDPAKVLVFGGTPQTLTGAGAVDVTSAVTHVVTTGADALTLADGTSGQRKFIVMKTDGGDGTLTPSNLGNGTTITFDDVGDSADLLFTNAAWHFMGGTATLA